MCNELSACKIIQMLHQYFFVLKYYTASHWSLILFGTFKVQVQKNQFEGYFGISSTAAAVVRLLIEVTVLFHSCY